MLKVQLDRMHDVFLYATQYGYSVGSTLIERILRLERFSKPNIQAKFSKTLDKRSTLILAAYSTEQKLSSSERYYLTLNL